LLTLVRIGASLSTLNLLYQGGTAGEILMQSHQARELHAAGAVALHLLTGLTLVATALLWLRTRDHLWAAAVSALVFIATFVQAAYGQADTLYIHVPLALAILLGAAAVLTWALLVPTRAAHGWRGEPRRPANAGDR
jgi:heme A synthase